jgi:glycosyltransferase involved in cell wall biosynthesis
MHTLGIDAFASRQERSGVEWYAYHLLRAMKPTTPEDWRVFLYSLTEAPSSKLQAPSTWEWKQLNWWPRRGWGQARLSWEMLRRPPNVLFVPGAMLPFIHPHRPWRKRWTITTIHDVEFLAHPDRYHAKDRRRQTLALDFALTHAARIVVPSEAVRVALEDRAQEDQMRVIPLGIDHTHFQPITDTASLERVRTTHNLPKSFVLYVGRIDRKKNLVALVDAFAEYKKQFGEQGLPLVLIGADGFGAKEVHAEIKKQQLKDSVRVLGYVPEEDLPALYRAAHVFVFPSTSEGFGLPVLQALACGVPTLVADTPVMHEVAGEAAKFADPHNTDAWVHALREVVTNGAVRDTLRATAVTQAQKFSWERTARDTWKIIQELVQ